MVREIFPRFGAVACRIEPVWQLPADFTGSQFRLSVFAGALGVLAGEIRAMLYTVENCQFPPTWSLCVCEFRTITGNDVKLTTTLWMSPMPRPVSKRMARFLAEN